MEPRKERTESDEDIELVTSPSVVPGSGRKIIADIASHRYEKIYPKSRMEGLPPSITFEIEPSERELTDLQDTFIYFRWSVVEQKNDGSIEKIPLDDYEEIIDEDGLRTGMVEVKIHPVIPEPAAPLSMFQDAYLTINDIPFPSLTQGLYYYSLYWRLLFDSSPQARETTLRELSNFYPREKGKLDQINLTQTANNRALMYMHSITKGGIQAETTIPLLTDFTSFRRGLPPQTKLEITLDKARCVQYLMSSEPNDNKTYDIQIHEAYIVVKRLTLEPLALKNYNEMILKTPAVFPFTSRQMRALSIPRSSLSFDFDVGSPGSQLPYQIRFGLVRKKAFDGSYSKSVYNFETFNLQQIRIKESNGFISSEINVMNRKDQYNTLTSGCLPSINEGGFSTERWMQRGASVEAIDFKNGYAIYTLDLSRSAVDPDDDPDLQSSPRREKVTITLDFENKTPYDCVLILEEFSHKVMRLGGDSNIPSFE